MAKKEDKGPVHPGRTEAQTQNGTGQQNGNGTPDASGATLCSAGSPVLSTSDITFSPTGGAGSAAADCFGVVMGNDTKYDFALWGGGWTFADKTDGAGSPVSLFDGSFLFQVTSEGNRDGKGTWLLTAADQNGDLPPNSPVYLDFLVVLKGSDRFAVYLFDDVEVDESGGGSWEITYANNGGQIPGLSHPSLLVREGRTPPDECTEPGGCGPQQVPAPGTLALMGLGLAALGAVRRRRRVA